MHSVKAVASLNCFDWSFHAARVVQLGPVAWQGAVVHNMSSNLKEYKVHLNVVPRVPYLSE